MRSESVAWERAAEVHMAARGWRQTGFIDQPTEAAIQAAFPDPCVTPSPVWRLLTAGVVAAVVLCVFAACVLVARTTAAAQIVLFFFAGVCLLVTDWLEASPPFARRGAAGATSLLGVGFFLAGLGLALGDSLGLRNDDLIDILLIASAVAWGAGCWRWGSPLFAVLSVLSVFLFLGRWDGRILWPVAGMVLTALASRGLDAKDWAPSHRLGAVVLVVAGILATYAAVNVYSLDAHLLENLARHHPQRGIPSRTLFTLSAVATGASPLAVLVSGAVTRRTFLLDTGLVLLALSLVTLGHYMHLAPLWTVLALGGAALVVIALVLERTLRRAAGQEIAGFTGEPLFSDERRQHALQIAPIAATFAPTARVEERPGFVGAGGQFGGGGASETF